jgi:hypothetical protein
VTFPNLWQAVADTPWATSIRESEVVFPALESVHVLSLMLMAGTIAVVDLRILGLVLRTTPAVEIERRVTPTTWAGFAVMAITGGLLFASEAADLQHNPAFLAKIALLALAGLNVLFFHMVARPRLLAAPSRGAAPAAARLSAGASLLIWSFVIVAGRAIAYFHHHGG